MLNILYTAAQGCIGHGQEDAADKYAFEQAVEEFGQKMLFSYHRSAHPDYKAMNGDEVQQWKPTQPSALANCIASNSIPQVVIDVDDEPSKESSKPDPPQRTEEV